MPPEITPSGTTSPEPSTVLAVDQTEAARISGLSAKTLGRLADAGEPVGRIKINRRVLYLRSTLETYLASKANTGVQS
jgi:hypothetical protein